MASLLKSSVNLILEQSAVGDGLNYVLKHPVQNDICRVQGVVVWNLRPLMASLLKSSVNLILALSASGDGLKFPQGGTLSLEVSPAELADATLMMHVGFARFCCVIPRTSWRAF